MPDSPLSELAKNENWSAVGDYFSSREPVNAEQYQIRAILRLNNSSSGVIDWHSVVTDLRLACECDPADLMPRINLVQALIDAGRNLLAFSEAQKIIQGNCDSPFVLEKFALAAAGVARWDEALKALTDLKTLANSHFAQMDNLRRLFRQLQTRWWEPIEKGDILMAPPERSDSNFLIRCFDDSIFMRRIQRSNLSSETFVEGLLNRANRSPFESRQIDWIIKSKNSPHIGLLSLVDIDFKNKRAELLVGFPVSLGKLSAVKACVHAIHYAFSRLDLEKIVSYVYSDNSSAQNNTIHLGFTNEGTLRDHIADGAGRADVYINGLLKTDWLSKPFCQKLNKRFVLE